MSRQSQFGGGEIAPLFRGRSDLPIYGKAVRKMRNFFASKHGAAVSRPGSLFINTTKTPHFDGQRLIPFVYSDTQSFVLEFGASYIRFHTNGGTLGTAVPGFFYEKTTTYATSHLRGLKYTQTGDILTITRRGYAAMELRRLPNWTLAALQALKVRADVSVVAQAAINTLNGTAEPAASDLNKLVFRGIFLAEAEPVAEGLALAAGNSAFTAWLTANPGDYAGAHVAFASNYYNLFETTLVNGPHWTFTEVAFTRKAPYFGGAAGGYPTLELATLAVPTASRPDEVWQWAVTLTIKETATGIQRETLPWFIGDSWDLAAGSVPVALADDLHAVYADKAVTIIRRTVAAAHKNRPAANAVPVDQSYQELGWNIYRGHGRKVMGLVGTATGDRFIDVGFAPDYATQPPLGTHPFLTYDYAGVLSSVEAPYAVGFFEDRRMFAGSYLRPGAVWGSATSDYPNYDLHELIHSAGESVLFELGARRLEEIVHLVTHDRLLIGTRSSWWQFGGARDAPLDFNSINTTVIDEVGTKDVTPLAIDGSILYVRAKGSGVRALRTDQGANYRGSDVSGHADHLFTGQAAYFPAVGVTKGIVDWTYAEDPWGVVWAVRDDGMLLSVQLNADAAGWSWHDGFHKNGNPAQYRSVCAVPEGDEDAVYALVRRSLAVALPIAAGGAATSFLSDPQGFVQCVERMTTRARNGGVEDDACVDCGLRFSGLPTTTIAGLIHLAGEDVWVVAKNNSPVGPLTVSAIGEITLPELPVANSGSNVVMFIGLRYVPELELLDVAAGRSGETRTAQKGVSKVGLEVDQTAGLEVGRDFDHLVETRPNTVSSGYGQPDAGTELVSASVPNKYEDGARVCVRQTKPLPVTVVAISRNLDMGGS